MGEGFIVPACADERGGLSGFVHSFDSGGAVDGPGIRFVLFLSGCLFQCLYCHNPDTLRIRNGTLSSVDEVIREISKYAAFLRFSGGVTLSGGEPLLQAPFAGAILSRVRRELGLHTALDTQGFLAGQLSDDWFEDVDLVLLDIKHIDPDKYRALTTRDLAPTLDFARRLSALRKPTWIRYVLVPGFTDDPDDVERLADFVATLDAVERVEVLPFHKMGERKWAELGMRYRLGGVPEPSPEQVRRVIEAFRRRGLFAC